MATSQTLPIPLQNKINIMMITNTHLNNPQDDTISTWFCPYIYPTYPCKCLMQLKPDILIINIASPHHTTHFIEQTFCHNYDSTTTSQCKKLKYQLLIDTLEYDGWYITLPILTLVFGERYIQIQSLNYLNIATSPSCLPMHVCNTST